MSTHFQWGFTAYFSKYSFPSIDYVTSELMYLNSSSFWALLVFAWDFLLASLLAPLQAVISVLQIIVGVVLLLCPQPLPTGFSHSLYCLWAVQTPSGPPIFVVLKPTMANTRLVRNNQSLNLPKWDFNPRVLQHQSPGSYQKWRLPMGWMFWKFWNFWSVLASCLHSAHSTNVGCHPI